ncbi:cytadherence high molecular weight protein 3-like [Vanessa tameamea]|uniref:Cytadherence high molecular weight protein 3-like n=1 Tax=Vanessa tameamea TaxID=334116 RepID=A0A8B8IQU1_VANTA|nr:uncharacterized protein LOC113403246 [Vanessa tameamea]
MKFLIFFGLLAAVATAENARGDPRIFNIIGGILDLLNPKPAERPTVVDKPVVVDGPFQPIIVGPAIVNPEYEQISAGPAIVDFEEISVGPAIIDETAPVVPAPVPSPVFPITSPLVQVIVNVESNGAGNPVAVEGVEPTPVIVVPGPVPRPEPVIVVDKPSY